MRKLLIAAGLVSGIAAPALGQTFGHLDKSGFRRAVPVLLLISRLSLLIAGR